MLAVKNCMLRLFRTNQWCGAQRPKMSDCILRVQAKTFRCSAVLLLCANVRAQLAAVQIGTALLVKFSVVHFSIWRELPTA